MTPFRRTVRGAAVVLLALTSAGAAGADTIVLKNGHVIQADRAWYDGTQLRYEKDGGVYGLPRALVERLEQKTPTPPTSDPDVVQARDRLAAGDATAASRFARAALNRDPRSLAALQALSAALLALGDHGGARIEAEKAVALDPRDARSQALLGDALLALGDRFGAEAAYRKSFEQHPDPDVRKKLAQLGPAPGAGPSRGAQFRIRYDGGVNEPLGTVVLRALNDAYADYARRLAFNPDDPITVVLQTDAEFQDGTVPQWAEGVNDGTIRVSVKGIDKPTPRLVSVLRHELAHSFVTARTGGNCPTWLQEGISQWLEGGDPARQDAGLAPLAREGKLLPLVSLEPPFQNLSAPDATQAYAESLSAVAHILRRRGEAGVIRLLSALADRLPSEEALPVALALSYGEIQRDWEEHLKVADRPGGSGSASARGVSR